MSTDTEKPEITVKIGENIEEKKNIPDSNSDSNLKPNLKPNSNLKINLKNKDERKYAVLMETNGKEIESWYYCLKYNGNEENLQHLQNQLEKVDFFILDDLSTFDLDLEHLISENTAKELTMLDLNSTSFHRKFDGKLSRIDFKFKRKDSNEKKIVKCFDLLGHGQIDDFISDEDIPEGAEFITDEENNSESESSSEEENLPRKKDVKLLPPILQDVPKFARNKKKGRKR